MLDSLPACQPAIPDRLQRRLAALAEFVALARTHIPHDGETKQVRYVPEPEGSTRLAQQLGQLTRGSALLGGRETVNEEDLCVVRRAGMDSIPAMRRVVINAMLAGKKATALHLGIPESTWSYLASDLRMLGLIQSAWDAEAGMGVRLLSPLAKRLLRQAGVRMKRGHVVKGDLVPMGV
jgi:hypothetical protein